jgi:hypothetical protein
MSARNSRDCSRFSDASKRADAISSTRWSNNAALTSFLLAMGL